MLGSDCEVHEPSQSYAATIREGATPIQVPVAGCFAQGTENGQDYCMQIASIDPVLLRDVSTGQLIDFEEEIPLDDIIEKVQLGECTLYAEEDVRVVTRRLPPKRGRDVGSTQTAGKGGGYSRGGNGGKKSHRPCHRDGCDEEGIYTCSRCKRIKYCSHACLEAS
jgi:hypothetical protein